VTYDGFIFSASFHPDGKYVVSAGCDELDEDDKSICLQGSARVWDATTGDEISRATFENSVTSAAFSPDGKYVVSTSAYGGIRFWEAMTGKENVSLDLPGATWLVMFSPDGKYVASADSDGLIGIWEPTTGRGIANMTGQGIIWSILFSPDGRYIAAIADGTITVWESATGTEVASLADVSAINSMAFSPDGKYIVTATQNGLIRQWVWQPADLISSVCSRLQRNLTQAEWKHYLGERAYEPVCPNLPIDSENVVTP
jgi:WD40 repeat protein